MKRNALVLALALAALPAFAGCNLPTAAAVTALGTVVTMLQDASIAVDAVDTLLTRLFANHPGLATTPVGEKALAVLDKARGALRHATTAIQDAQAAGKEPDPLKVFGDFAAAWSELEVAYSEVAGAASPGGVGAKAALPVDAPKAAKLR